MRTSIWTKQSFDHTNFIDREFGRNSSRSYFNCAMMLVILAICAGGGMGKKQLLERFQ